MPHSATNGVQYLIKLEGTVCTFECKSGHQMTHDYSKGPISRRLPEEYLKKTASYWGLGIKSNGTRGHCYGWCQKCQNEADGINDVLPKLQAER